MKILMISKGDLDQYLPQSVDVNGYYFPVKIACI